GLKALGPGQIIAVASHLSWDEWLGGIACGCGEGDDEEVAIVAPILLARLWLRQGDRARGAVGQVGTAPDEVTHGFVGRDPGSACHGPAGTVLDGEAQAEAAA